MRTFLSRRDRDARACRRLQEAREWVDGNSSTKMVYWEVRGVPGIPLLNNGRPEHYSSYSSIASCCTAGAMIMLLLCGMILLTAVNIGDVINRYVWL